MSSIPAEHGALLHSVLVVWCGRPDRLLAAVHRLVSHSFGEAFFEGDTLLKLDMMVEKEVSRGGIVRVVVKEYRK